MPERPLHPCNYCGAHEGWLFYVLRTVRTFIFCSCIVLMTVYLSYMIHSKEEMQNLDRLEEEIKEYKEKMMKNIEEAEARREETFENEYVENSEECVERNDAGRIDQAPIRRIIDEELMVFDADRTGKTDFAMGALGGEVVSTPDTKPYPICGSSLEILGISTSKRTDDPQTILEPSLAPGDCWAFAGRKGAVVVRLFAKIVVTDVALEHVPREVSPTGDISSAPKIFSVVGLESPENVGGHSFGSFVYSENGAAVQSFRVVTPGPPTQFLRVDFQDNHGNAKYTCVYRLRVHGYISSCNS